MIRCDTKSSEHSVAYGMMTGKLAAELEYSSWRASGFYGIFLKTFRPVGSTWRLYNFLFLLASDLPTETLRSDGYRTCY